MKDVLIISRCLKREKYGRALFNFWGFFHGVKLKVINLQFDQNKWGDFVAEGEDYYIHAKMEKVENGVFYGDIIRIKKIDQISLF